MRLKYFSKLPLSVHFFPLFFLINYWSSVVASVVLPQLCNHHFLFCFFLKKKWLFKKKRVEGERKGGGVTSP